MALMWPLFVVVVATVIAAIIVSGLPDDSNFAVSASGPWVAILLLGPPALLIILWMVGRRRERSRPRVDKPRTRPRVDKA